MAFPNTVMSLMRGLKRVLRVLLIPSASEDIESPALEKDRPEQTVPLLPHVRPSTSKTDPGTKLWNVYIGEARRYDEDLLKGWKEDMDGMLLFSALYSASLTAFIIESYKTLQDDPAQNTVALLSQISQQLSAVLNGTSVPMQSSSDFTPPVSALVCNTFWFLSLALALTCSLLATFVQQWTRDFIHKTNLRPSPVRQAKVLAFLYLGLRDFGMHSFVDTIPILLHISLLLFFGGLVPFLLPVNRPLTYLMACVLAVFVTVYFALTCIPLVFFDAPYRTPLSTALWRLRNAVPGLLTPGQHSRLPDQTLTEAMLEKSLENPLERDNKAMVYTMKSLIDDTELLPFIEAIPDAITQPRPDYVYVTNSDLFISLLQTSDPAVNIMSRIEQFLMMSDGWTDPAFRTRASLACPRALWSLAYMLVQGGNLRNRYPMHGFHEPVRGLNPYIYASGEALQLDKDYVEPYRRLIRGILGSSHLHALDQKTMYSAFALMRLNWVCNIRRSVDIVGELLMEKGKSPTIATPEQLRKRFARAAAVWAGIDQSVPVFIRYSKADTIMSGDYPLPSKHLGQTLEDGSTSVDPGRQLADVENILSSLQNGPIWHSMRLHVLLEYLHMTEDLVVSGILPYEFEATCEAIYPGSQRAIVQWDDWLTSTLSNDSTAPLRWLRNHLDHEATAPGATTDIAFVQYMKLFMSVPIGLSDDPRAVEGRRFILTYFCRNIDRLDPWSPISSMLGFNSWDTLRVGDCILKGLRDGCHESSLVLEAACLVLTRNELAYTNSELLMDLWEALRVAHSSIQDNEIYPVIRDLLAQTLFRRITLDPSDFSPMAHNDTFQAALDQAVLDLLQEYLPEIFPLSSSPAFYHSSLNISMIARRIDLVLKYSHHELFHLTGMRYSSYLLEDMMEPVLEISQLRFAQCVSDRVNIWKNRDGEHRPSWIEEFSNIFYPFMIRVRTPPSEPLQWKWDWITSSQCAKILLDTLVGEEFGQEDPQDPFVSTVMKEGRQRVLDRCRVVLSLENDEHERTMAGSQADKSDVP
ncbi:hypothetical protein D9758_005900 [Tetrapyrgos nigripes]|uniref:DUF6535 domain-containing protein n=1 Tax=Tetrapyrgos nigripes TaxID=182062 RepID=A0A8H5LH82_9AGAR|nr:hypothetical protein D9758_005900 [Tetrapyrgos nigripes]